MLDTIIIGAGISGLTVARLLQRTERSVCVLEKQTRAGGAILSEQRDGYLMEHGPNTVQIASPELVQLLDTLDLDLTPLEANPAASKRFILRNGKPVAAPSSPLSGITNPLLSFGAKLRLAREYFVKANPKDDERLADFVRRRVGNEFLDYVINPMVSGVYAGDPEKLITSTAFPKVYALERDYGGLIKGALAKRKEQKASGKPKSKPRLLTYRNGLQSLTDALGDALGEHLHTGANVTQIQREGKAFRVTWQEGDDPIFHTEVARRLVITTPTHAMPDLPGEPPMKLTWESLAEIPYAGVSVIHLAYPRKAIKHPLDGFGCLVPQKENRHLLGVLFPSSLFENRAPKDHALLTVFAGGSRQPDYVSKSDEELLPLIKQDLADILGITGEPTLTVRKNWHRAIPQYTHEHYCRLPVFIAAENAYDGLHFCGNFRNGIGVSQCLMQALQLANKLING